VTPLMLFMTTLGELENELTDMIDSSFRQRGLSRVAAARTHAPRNFAYAERMLDEARFELSYAKEYQKIKMLGAVK
jgi:hypothetical protein